MLFDWSPRLLLALIEGLPEDGAYVADVRARMPYTEQRPVKPTGNDPAEWRGWSKTEWLLADIADRIQLLMIATGRWEKKPPEFDPYPRPHKQRPFRVRDFIERFGSAGRY